MPDVESFLTRKVGPLPVWGYAALAGGLVAIVYLYRKGGQPDTTAQAAQAPTAAGAPGTSPYAPSPIVITTPPTSPAAQPAGAPPAPAPTQAQVMSNSIWGKGGGVYVFASPADTAQVGIVPDKTTLPSGGPPVLGGSHSANGVTSSYWQPIGWSGATAYLWGPESAPAGSPTGMGGGQSVRMIPRSGSGNVMRFAGSHAHHQFINTAGMGGGGIRHLAARTGVPAARIMALNPHLRTGFGTWGDGVTRLA